MESILFTIGFTQKTAEEFFRLLQEARVQKLIDVRENRVGQLAGFAKYPDLAYFLDRIGGIAYEYHPAFAPTPEIRDAYRATHDWARYEQSYRQLMADRKVLDQADPAAFAGRVALLCSEPTAEYCHRRLAAEMLAQHWTALGHQVEIKHLVLARPVRQKKRIHSRDEGTDSI
jgi:uncharacterized protein (DUF488 family)